MTVPDPTAPTAEDVIAEAAGRTLREHQPTTGMSVTSGVTCRCGYWSGVEVPGKTRPVGYQGLQWHQAVRVSAAVVAAVRDMTVEQQAELLGGYVETALATAVWRDGHAVPSARAIGPWRTEP